MEEQSEGQNEKVYVALGKDVKEGKANLLWVLQNYLDRDKKLVITHVHTPANKINIMGAQFPVSQLAEPEVMAYRLLERDKMHKRLNEYLEICSSQKVEADKVVIERENTAKGIVDLIHENGITELVMGAASDWRYSRKLRAPRSKKAIFVQQKADPSCKILFVCRGNLICTRETGEGEVSVRSRSSISSTTSSSPQSIMSDQHRQINQFPSISPSIDLTLSESIHTTIDSTNTSMNVMENQENITNEWTTKGLDENVNSTNEAGPSFVSKDLEIEEEYESSSSPKDGSVGDDISLIDIDLYEQLKDALMEAQELKNEAYEGTRRRQKAERDLLEASKKAKVAENSYLKEARERKDAQEKLAREKLEIEQEKQQLDRIVNQINTAREQRLALELKISDSESILKDFESKLSHAYGLLESLRLEQPLNAHQIKEGHSFNMDLEAVDSLKEFSYEELIRGTDGFDESVKIGEGGHGSVFKGLVGDNIVVAIKMLNHDVFQGEQEFSQKMANLSNIRHPNLITLIGGCTEARALIYEYASKGSLEDNIRAKNQVMTWQVRVSIASEICAALGYLHSAKPNPIIHGNLKPNNILFDSNYSVKLTDLHLGTTFYPSYTARRAALAYVEPEFLATGELVPACDIYSLGIILLILLTGRPAFRIKKFVQEELDKESVHDVLDGSAGDWPLEETRQLVTSALRCCDKKRESRSSLDEVRCVVESVLNVAKSSEARSWSFGSGSDSGSSVPSYFLCPILKEIMKDPQIAADGFTYEAEAIKEWTDNGHDTSPMTNLKLPSYELIPNHALRSAILEWQHKRR